jgi:hypothetical protein
MTFLGIGPRNAKISVVAGASYAVLYLAIMAYILSGLPLNLPADRAIMSANPLIYLFAYLASFGNLTSRGMYVALGAAASFGLGAALVYAGFVLNRISRGSYLLFCVPLIVWILASFGVF